jgi:hypothetical protein
MAFDKAKKKTIEKKVTVVKPKKDYGNPFPTVDMLKKEKNGRGQKEFIKYISGEHINLRDAVYAKCYDCSGYYADGIADCGCKNCPLYPFMPYSPIKPILRKRKEHKL